MFSRRMLLSTVLIAFLAVTSMPALASREFVTSFTFIEDYTPQYCWVRHETAGSDFLHIVPTSGGPTSFDVFFYSEGRPSGFALSSRHFETTGDGVFLRVTGSDWAHGPYDNVGISTWGGNLPASFDVYVIRDTTAFETPWEDSWYVDPGYPDPNPGGILLDVGTDVEHPYTHWAHLITVFTARLNVRRFGGLDADLRQIEFDMYGEPGVNIGHYEALPPFTGMEVTDAGGGVHVSIWADESIEADPVYACEFRLGRGCWGLITLSNCVFIDSTGESTAAECFAPLRIQWDKFWIVKTEPCTWGRIKSIYR